MDKEISKIDAQKKIRQVFSELKVKNPEKIKKIKRLAMHYHISLQPWKQMYCKKCFSVFNAENSKTRIKKGKKIVKCNECGAISRVLLKL